MLAEAGLNDIRVETTTEKLQFASGAHLWGWLVNSNPIAGEILAQLDLTEQQTALVRRRSTTWSASVPAAAPTPS